MKACRRCGCARSAHEHYGHYSIVTTWCAFMHECGCKGYKPVRWYHRKPATSTVAIRAKLGRVRSG